MLYHRHCRRTMSIVEVGKDSVLYSCCACGRYLHQLHTVVGNSSSFLHSYLSLSLSDGNGNSLYWRTRTVAKGHVHRSCAVSMR
jgi:hypothetical protein